ncbi:ATP-binding protein [Streptomyces sp. NPDC006872]|uniref:ATP-binding protein n=1 Tax=Streptomyces sp. NPDC006872 TaxID=3155720 RepID=UPI00341023AB
MTAPLYPGLPENALLVLIGASGAGKSTLAGTWPEHQVVSLDRLRGVMADDCGAQEATADAVDAMHLIVDRRMARRLNTVVDATSVYAKDRAPLVDAAKRHGMPVIAVLVSTPLPVCIERQQTRPANRSVPDDTVTAQHQAMLHSHPNLRAEGFNEVVFSDQLHRLEPLLRRASHAQRTEQGRDGDDSLGDLVRCYFGSEVMPLWRWRDGSQLAGGDRVGEIRLGPDRLVLALRSDVAGDGEVDIGFDLLVACPVDDDCDAPAWAPVCSVTDLLAAHTSDTGQHPDTACTVHGDLGDVDQEADYPDDDPEGRADLEAQAMEAVRG